MSRAAMLNERDLRHDVVRDAVSDRNNERLQKASRLKRMSSQVGLEPARDHRLHGCKSTHKCRANARGFNDFDLREPLQDLFP